ncbi:cell division protein ZipA [Alteromonas sp. 345S023]|uniref:Cell division protein ZipA n=1 Tax=Alteromonas profundi TaxID=2696062 RepID=A0A7X5LLJ8_9ALTE|nr:cell division protein ZipA [Alteromonas profundi]NDV91588.1 cell division protein ZipA [Alteromonas profundi]
MEDELRLSLLIAGTCFIVAVLAHGIWKIRKNNRSVTKPRREPRQWDNTPVDAEPDQDYAGEEKADFDELGIGKVRVVSPAPGTDNDDPHRRDSQTATPTNTRNPDEPMSHVEGNSHSENKGSQSHNGETQRQNSATPCTDEEPKGVDKTGNDKDATPLDARATQSKTLVSEEPKLYGSVVSNPKPHLQGQPRSTADTETDNAPEFPEPPGFLLKEDSDTTEGVIAPANTQGPQSAECHASSTYNEGEEKKHRTEAVSQPAEAPKATPETITASELSEKSAKRTKPKRARTGTQQRQEPRFGDDQMRIDFDDSIDSSSQPSTPDNAKTDSEAAQALEPEVLVLNVKAPEDKPINGAVLLPMLLTLGFKFGDQDIFHRHVNSNGKGPVLFSLANMFKPGVFDIDKLETFATQGVSLFMILPIEADPHQVFNMMHNAARKLADEFDAQVLDGRRSVLTKQGLQQYVEKIREFERKRMIARQ